MIFTCFDSLNPSQQFFSHNGTGLPEIHTSEPTQSNALPNEPLSFA